MLCKYHISFSCWLLLLIFPTQCSTSECWSGQYTYYLGGRCSNCPSGQTQSGKCLNNGPCCLPCGQSTYQFDYLPEHFNINAGCRRCPVRHQTDLILTSSNRDGLEDCTPCPYEHSYMKQGPFIDVNVDDNVSFQCRECPEHSTQNEITNQHQYIDESVPYPSWTGNDDFGQHADNFMSCVCNAGFFFQQNASADEHTCEECPRGTYKSTISNTETCHACPPFYNAHSTARSDCLCDTPLNCTCNAGYEGQNGQICAECPSVTYKSTISNTDTCQPCPLFSNSPSQSTAESDCLCDAPFVKHADGTCVCPVDTFYENIPATCTNCQANAQAPMGSNTSLDCTCNADYEGQTGQICAECPSGTYKSTISNTDTCQPCPPFSNSPSQSTAESDCLCNAPFVKNADETCVCPVDTFYENDPATCTNCQANAQAPIGSNTLLNCICSAGYHGQNGQICAECPIGKYKSFAGTSP